MSRCIEHRPPSEAAGSKARIIGEPWHGPLTAGMTATAYDGVQDAAPLHIPEGIGIRRTVALGQIPNGDRAHSVVIPGTNTKDTPRRPAI